MARRRLPAKSDSSWRKSWSTTPVGVAVLPAEEPRQPEHDADREPPGAERVHGGQREELQQLAPEERGEVLGKRRPVVRRGHARRRRAPTRRTRSTSTLVGRSEPGLSIRRASSAPVEWPTMLTTPPRWSRSRWIDSARSAARRGQRGRRLGEDDADLSVQARGRADLGEQIPDVPEVGEVAQVGEAEEARDEDDVVRSGQLGAGTLAEQAGWDALRQSRRRMREFPAIRTWSGTVARPARSAAVHRGRAVRMRCHRVSPGLLLLLGACAGSKPPAPPPPAPSPRWPRRAWHRRQRRAAAAHRARGTHGGPAVRRRAGGRLRVAPEEEGPRRGEVPPAEDAYADAVMESTERLRDDAVPGSPEPRAADRRLGAVVPERVLVLPPRRAGKAVPDSCRKRGSLDAPEEVLLDQNQMAEGKQFLRSASGW